MHSSADALRHVCHAPKNRKPIAGRGKDMDSLYEVHSKQAPRSNEADNEDNEANRGYEVDTSKLPSTKHPINFVVGGPGGGVPSGGDGEGEDRRRNERGQAEGGKP